MDEPPSSTPVPPQQEQAKLSVMARVVSWYENLTTLQKLLWIALTLLGPIVASFVPAIFPGTTVRVTVTVLFVPFCVSVIWLFWLTHWLKLLKIGATAGAVVIAGAALVAVWAPMSVRSSNQPTSRYSAMFGLGIHQEHGKTRLVITDPSANLGGAQVWKILITCVALPPSWNHQWSGVTSIARLPLIKYSVAFPSTLGSMDFSPGNCAIPPNTTEVNDIYFVVSSAGTLTEAPNVQERELVYVNNQWEAVNTLGPATLAAHNCCYEQMKAFLQQHPFPYATPDMSP